MLTLGPSPRSLALYSLIIDREAGLLVALSVVVTMVIIVQYLKQNATLDFLNRNIVAVRNMTPPDVQESHHKRIATLEVTHNQTMREAQDEVRRLRAQLDRLNSEYEWISIMYQDQMRSNEKQEDRITYLEKKLKEFGSQVPVEWLRHFLLCVPDQLR